MDSKIKTIATAFNMSVVLKEKVQIHIATHNRQVKETSSGDKVNLGKILNTGLELYFKKLKGDIDD